MKLITGVLSILLLFTFSACSKTDSPPPAVRPDTVEVIKPDKTFSDSTAEPIYIQATENGGFNIYSQDKQLMLEYTKQNTDSISLEILKDIFLSGQYYNKEDCKIFTYRDSEPLILH